jgi:hypothetical protein
MISVKTSGLVATRQSQAGGASGTSGYFALFSGRAKP